MQKQLRFFNLLLFTIVAALNNVSAMAMQDDSRLNELFDDLRRVDSLFAAKVVENKIWDI